MEDWRYASMVLDRLQVGGIEIAWDTSQLHLAAALHILCGDGIGVLRHREGGAAHILAFFK